MKELGMRNLRMRRALGFAAGILLFSTANVCAGSTKIAVVKKAERATRPKLVVMIVVDQMRGDYVDKFRGQWSGGLKRLVDGRRVVPRRGLSLCGDGNVRGAFDNFDGRVSCEPRNGGQCVVGTRSAKDGDLHERSKGEELGVCGGEHEAAGIRRGECRFLRSPRN